MAFTGFPKEGLSWFDGLALAQNREWFQANKQGYELLWLEPMKALLEELKAPLKKIYGRPMGEGKIFRLNRDVRFAKDKRPYKTTCAAVLRFEGDGPMEGPAPFYIHLGSEEAIGFGFYHLDPSSLQRLRKLIIDDKTGKKVGALFAAAEKVGLHPDAMETLKRPPPGVDKEHPRVELLKRKGFALTREDIPKSVRFNAKLKDWLVEQAKAAAPVIKWGLAQKLVSSPNS